MIVYRWKVPGFQIFLGALSLFLLARGATFLKHFVRKPELTAPLRGQAVAEKAGCFSCHGPEGRGGIPDPTSKSGSIPSWDEPTIATYAKNESEIRAWILFGAPSARTGEKSKELFIPMPAYESRLSKSEFEDLMAYFRAVSGWCTDIPEAAFEGRKIALRAGCFGCHGPSGIGGRNNPGSFTGSIPAWDGDDFAELVRNEQELREWILDGHPQRLWLNFAARRFLERQTITMPGYRRLLSENDLNQLVAYIDWLRKK